MADVEIDPMPEIEAMASVAKALTGLDRGARLRVLEWAAARYQVSINGAGQQSSADDDEADDNGGEDGDAGDAPSYEHFAELFAAASPKSDADKALVAAYWVQVHDGNDTWGSHKLNKELKNLGHAVGHIAQALDANIKKKPQLGIQLKKSGSSQQARKTYKVTGEGIKYAEQMIVPVGG